MTDFPSETVYFLENYFNVVVSSFLFRSNYLFEDIHDFFTPTMYTRLGKRKFTRHERECRTARACHKLFFSLLKLTTFFILHVMCMMGNVSFNIQSNPSHERSKGRGKGNLPSKNVESIKKIT